MKDGWGRGTGDGTETGTVTEEDGTRTKSEFSLYIPVIFYERCK
jgi:hypothetical protein